MNKMKYIVGIWPRVCRGICDRVPGSKRSRLGQ